GAGGAETEWPYSDARADEQSAPPTAFEAEGAHDDLGTGADFGTTPSLQPGANETSSDEQRDGKTAAAKASTTKPSTTKPVMADHDLERLESSLRWLQRQEAAVTTPLPRGANLPPAGGLAGVEAGDRPQG